MTTALDVLSGLVLEDGRRWGTAATKIQLDDAKAVLEPGEGPRRFWIGRPRGYSKTQDAAGCALAELVTGTISSATPIYAAAADRQQASLVIDSIAGFVERSKLGHLVEVQAWRAVHRGSGASVEVLAADAAGAFGIRPSRLIVDELCQWPDTRQARKFYEALWTSLPKVPGSVGTIITTAGSPGHWSHAVFDRAVKESKLWRVSMTNDPAPWIDAELIEAERRGLTDSAFARLWCNIWAQPEDALVSGDDLEAAAVLDGPLLPVEGTRYVLALDVGLVNDRTVLVAAHKEGVGEDERVILDRIWRWQGTRRNPVSLSEVESVVAEAHNRYPGEVVADPFQAVQLLERLSKRGIRASKLDFTSTSVGQFATSLLRLLRSRRLDLPNDPILLEELAAVRIIENAAGTPRLDHASGAHDDQAVALALACYRLTDGAPRRRTGPRRVGSHWRRQQALERGEVVEEDVEPPRREARPSIWSPSPIDGLGSWAR
jgi:phage terminase large subunit-like protein